MPNVYLVTDLSCHMLCGEETAGTSQARGPGPCGSRRCPRAVPCPEMADTTCDPKAAGQAPCFLTKEAGKQEGGMGSSGVGTSGPPACSQHLRRRTDWPAAACPLRAQGIRFAPGRRFPWGDREVSPQGPRCCYYSPWSIVHVTCAMALPGTRPCDLGAHKSCTPSARARASLTPR